MKRFLTSLLLWALFAVPVLLWAGCVRWEWRECRQVGHGKLYCFVKLGNHR